METTRFERSIREFYLTGRITDSYSINAFGELLDFAKAFYPDIWWELTEYDYFGPYHI